MDPKQEVGVFEPDEEIAEKEPTAPRRRWLWKCAGAVFNLLAGTAVCAAVLWYRGTQETPQATVPALDRQPQVEVAPPDMTPNTEPPAPSQPTEYVSIESPPVDPLIQADVMLQSGNYVGALQLYEQLASRSSVGIDPAITYRQAVCHELLGNHSDGLLRYRSIMDSGITGPLVDAARLGEARVWQQQGRFDLARSSLQTMLMGHGDRPEHVATILHRCAQLSAAELQPPQGDLFDDEIILNETGGTDAAYLLALAREGHLPEKPRLVPTGLTLLDQFSSHPKDTQVSIAYDATFVREILDQISNATALSFRMSAAIEDSLIKRSVTVRMADASLATVLDCLLEPAGLVWRLEEGIVTIRLLSSLDRQELVTHRTEQALRMCNSALILYPDAAEATMTSLSLGNVNFWSGNYGQAISAYDELERRVDGSDLMVVLSFNQAKSHLMMNRRPQSQQCFFRVVDSARGKSIEAVAYTFLGRLALEDSQIENSTRYLARAVSFARDDTARRQAAVMLGAAYLVAGNRQSANQVLIEHRDVLRVEPARSIAAFVSAYARYSATVTGGELIRRERDLTAALAQVEPSRFLGSVGYLLVGKAYRELGLPDQMEAVYTEGISATQPHLLRDEMMYELAEQLAEMAEWQKAEAWYDRLIRESDSQWARDARLGVAKVTYHSDRLSESLDQCYALLTDDPPIEQKRELLRLMGRIYERQNEHYKAALCFAGMVPTTATGSKQGAER